VASSHQSPWTDHQSKAASSKEPATPSISGAPTQQRHDFSHLSSTFLYSFSVYQYPQTNDKRDRSAASFRHYFFSFSSPTTHNSTKTHYRLHLSANFQRRTTSAGRSNTAFSSFYRSSKQPRGIRPPGARSKRRRAWVGQGSPGLLRDRRAQHDQNGLYGGGKLRSGPGILQRTKESLFGEKGQWGILWIISNF